MKMKISTLFILLCATLTAQVRTITGMVSNENTPLPGANVIIKGTTSGVQTNFDGLYTIEASKDDILVFSYINYKSQEVKVDNQNEIDITLQLDNELSEIILTAHNIARDKKAIGYDVDVIDGDLLARKIEQDVTRTLDGESAGVKITQTSGLAGSGTNVVIRNYNSINGNNQALFIVDGVPYSNGNSAIGGAFQANNGSSRGLDLDPNNIQSVTVLKGLAAATLYGSEGRNGVILISTKTGSRQEDSTYDEDEEQAACGAVVMRLNNKSGTSGLGKEKLYIVDGQAINPYFNDLIENLDQEYIENRNTYDKKDGKRLFGDLAKNGCVVITTPKGNYTIENDVNYTKHAESAFLAVHKNPISTFALDVNTNGYTAIQDKIMTGQDISFDAVRIEEMINYFDYDYDAPTGEAPIALHTELMPTPWNSKTKLVRIGLKTKELKQRNIAAYNYTVAEDVKTQVVFNSNLVKSYRLIGYGNKQLVTDPAKDDPQTTASLKSGHSVTALYEVALNPANAITQEILEVKLKYKNPGGARKMLSTTVLNTTQEASSDFKFAAAVALFGMQLQQSRYIQKTSKDDVLALAIAGQEHDPDGARSKFMQLVKSR